MTHTFNCEGHGSGHEVPIPKIINRLMTSLLKITLFLMVFLCPSCAQKGYRDIFTPHDIDIREYIYESSTGNDIGFYRLNKRIESYEDYLEVKNEREEREYIYQLNEKKNSSPSSKAKYEQQLKEFKTQLQTKYKDRTHARLLFLQKFYSDLYQLTNKEFTKKYKKTVRVIFLMNSNINTACIMAGKAMHGMSSPTMRSTLPPNSALPISTATPKM